MIIARVFASQALSHNPIRKHDSWAGQTQVTSLSLHEYLPRTLSCWLAEVSWLCDALYLIVVAFIQTARRRLSPWLFLRFEDSAFGLYENYDFNDTRPNSPSVKTMWIFGHRWTLSRRTYRYIDGLHTFFHYSNNNNVIMKFKIKPLGNTLISR